MDTRLLGLGLGPRAARGGGAPRGGQGVGRQRPPGRELAGLPPPPPPAPASPREVEVTGGRGPSGLEPGLAPSLRRGRPPAWLWPAGPGPCTLQSPTFFDRLRTSTRDGGVTETPVGRGFILVQFPPIAPGVCFPFYLARFTGPKVSSGPSATGCNESGHSGLGQEALSSQVGRGILHSPERAPAPFPPQ